MIERLRLRRWRSFDSIDLAFDRGTTFVVAPNGVGKTSLLLGMAWAIFGEQAGVEARDCIRAGASSADAEVVLLLDGDRRLTIRRTVSARRRQKTDHDLEGTAIGDPELLATLEEAFAVRPAIAAQLSMMVGGGHVASERGLDLEEHLQQAFGVAGLRAAADQASAMAKAAERARQQERATASLSREAREAGEAELAELVLAIDQAAEQRPALAAGLEAATRQREAATAWRQHEEALRRRQEALDGLAAAAGALDLDGSPEMLPAAIESAAAAARRQVAEATERITELRVGAGVAEQALALLEREEPSCPTCLRAFHGSELEEAVRAQRAELAGAGAEEARWRSERSDLERRLEQLLTLANLAARIPGEVAPPPVERPGGDPDDLTDRSLVALQEHDTQVGRLEQARDVLARQLETDDDRQRGERAQRAAYRNEALAGAAALALADAADQLTSGYIEPLSQQIRWRWKALFGEEGLQLEPDGSIVRVVGDRQLPWDSLSGGERIWARLVTHLLVVATSTKLPFAWFDEPLEHLDPRARRAVAAALATATRTGGPRQLVVTTYEHAIARQLAADVPEASILYLRPPARS